MTRILGIEHVLMADFNAFVIFSDWTSTEAQNRVDTYWMCGGVAGGLAGYTMYGGHRILGGAAIGGLLGILTHAILPMPKSKE